MSKLKFIDARNFLAPGFPLAEIVRHLDSGGVIIHPTETVYGFGGILDRDVTNKITCLKRRTLGKPMLLLVPDRKSIEALRWTPEALMLADAFWPGPLTIVLSDTDADYPVSVRNGEGGVAVRVSSHPVVHTLMNELAGPMVSTSANISGDRPLLDTTDIRKRKYFSLEQDLMVLNMGPLPHSLPSTVIDCSRKTVEILREGAIPFREIERILPGVTVNVHT